MEYRPVQWTAISVMSRRLPYRCFIASVFLYWNCGIKHYASTNTSILTTFLSPNCDFRGLGASKKISRLPILRPHKLFYSSTTAHYIEWHRSPINVLYGVRPSHFRPWCLWTSDWQCHAQLCHFVNAQRSMTFSAHADRCIRLRRPVMCRVGRYTLITRTYTI